MNTIDIPKEWDLVAERIKQTKLLFVVSKTLPGLSQQRCDSHSLQPALAARYSGITWKCFFFPECFRHLFCWEYSRFFTYSSKVNCSLAFEKVHPSGKAAVF